MALVEDRTKELKIIINTNKSCYKQKIFSRKEGGLELGMIIDESCCRQTGIIF